MKKLTRGKIDAFLSRHASPANVLDIGARKGEHARYFPNAYTIDIDPTRDPDQVADAQRMPFANASFAGIVCSEVLEHIPDPRAAAAEMYRVLEPGGFLVLTTRFLFPVHDAPGDFFRYTPYGLCELFKEWDEVSVEAENEPFSAIAVQLQRIGMQSDLRGGKVTKAALYGLARVCDLLDPLITRTYGDIRRQQAIPSFMSSGVYIYCRKPQKPRTA